MSDGTPLLLLTRPRASSEAFLRQLEEYLGRSVDCIISPVLEIVDHGGVPDVTPYQTLVFSSVHAVERLGRAGFLQDRSARTVGEATALAARAFGADAEALGADADAFVGQARFLAPPCLHCRGVHTRGAIAKRLRDSGVPCDEAVVYAQQETALSGDALTAIASGRHIVAPVFSPRSASLLASQLPRGASVAALAISPAAASALAKMGSTQVAEEPTAQAMLHLVAHSL